MDDEETPGQTLVCWLTDEEYAAIARLIGLPMDVEVVAVIARLREVNPGE